MICRECLGRETSQQSIVVSIKTKVQYFINLAEDVAVKVIKLNSLTFQKLE